MVYATGRIGTRGTFLRKQDAEPVSEARMPSQDRTPVYPLTPAGLR
jgi:hypothetical protein